MKPKTKHVLLLIVVLMGIVILVAILLVTSIFLSNFFKHHPISTNWLIFIFAVMIIAAWIIDVLDKRKTSKEKTTFLKNGQQVLPDYKTEFAHFYNLYFKDNKKFLTQNAKLIKNASNFDLKQLKPIEVLYLFADAKNLVQVIDWKGEENETEIETFIEVLLNQKLVWANTAKLRLGVAEDTQRDGKFIVSLFKAIDKDLRTISQRLLFFDMKWDAFVYTVVSYKSYSDIKSERSTYFYGSDKLRR